MTNRETLPFKILFSFWHVLALSGRSFIDRLSPKISISIILTDVGQFLTKKHLTLIV